MQASWGGCDLEYDESDHNRISELFPKCASRPMACRAQRRVPASAQCCMHHTCRNLNHLFASSPMNGIRATQLVTSATAEGPMAVAGSQQMPELTLERMQVSLEAWCGVSCSQTKLVFLSRGASPLLRRGGGPRQQLSLTAYNAARPCPGPVCSRRPRKTCLPMYFIPSPVSIHFSDPAGMSAHAWWALAHGLAVTSKQLTSDTAGLACMFTLACSKAGPALTCVCNHRSTANPNNKTRCPAVCACASNPHSRAGPASATTLMCCLALQVCTCIPVQQVKTCTTFMCFHVSAGVRAHSSCSAAGSAALHCRQLHPRRLSLQHCHRTPRGQPGLPQWRPGADLQLLTGLQGDHLPAGVLCCHRRAHGESCWRLGVLVVHWCQCAAHAVVLHNCCCSQVGLLQWYLGLPVLCVSPACCQHSTHQQEHLAATATLLDGCKGTCLLQCDVHLGFPSTLLASYCCLLA